MDQTSGWRPYLAPQSSNKPTRTLTPVPVGDSSKTYGAITAHNSFVHAGENYLIHDKYKDAVSRLVQSFMYHEINTRANVISEAHKGTFEWLFEAHPSCEADKVWANRKLQEWLVAGSGFFLIEGKPGSGKSTLMKFVRTHRKTRKLLAQGQTGEPLVLSHYFWLAGTELQRSFKGMLLSLARQVCETLSDSVIYNLSLEHDAVYPDDWSERGLETLLLQVFSRLTVKVLIVLDGLDEFDLKDRPSRLLAFLSRFQTDSQDTLLLVSSRPTLWSSQHFESSPKLILQELTADDITAYTVDVLSEEFHFNAHDLDPQTLERLQELVIAKAEGVFLWVKYAIHSLAVGMEYFDDLEELEKRLAELPKGMEELYQLTWHRYQEGNSRHRKEAAMFLSVLSIQSTIWPSHPPPTIFNLAVTLDSETWTLYRTKNRKLDDIEKRCKKIEKLLLIRTAGLIICDAEGPVIEKSISYLHRTVQDFLFGTPFGQSITELDQKDCLRLSKGRIHGALANIIERGKVYISDVEYLSTMLYQCEVNSKSETYEDCVTWIDQGLRQMVSTCTNNSVSATWLHDLQVSEGEYYPLMSDFAGFLLSDGVWGIAQRFLCSRHLSQDYMNYLLSRIVIVMMKLDRTSRSAMFDIDLEPVLSFVQWLLHKGANPAAKCRFRAYPGTGRTMALSATEVLFSLLFSQAVEKAEDIKEAITFCRRIWPTGFQVNLMISHRSRHFEAQDRLTPLRPGTVSLISIHRNLPIETAWAISFQRDSSEQRALLSTSLDAVIIPSVPETLALSARELTDDLKLELLIDIMENKSFPFGKKDDVIREEENCELRELDLYGYLEAEGLMLPAGVQFEPPHI